MTRKINQAGLDLIKHFEGFESVAYFDAVGVPTIGYGHTRTVSANDVSNEKRIDQAEAEHLLRSDCASAEEDVVRYIDVPLNGNQFSALVSFVFNLGGGALKSSTLRRKLNAGDYDSVPSEMARWVRAGGKVLRGLVRRRQAEGELFTTPDGVAATSAPEREVARRVMPIGTDDSPSDGYLFDPSVDLEHGSVDDNGAMRYSHLNQNVPDGYVTAFQTDLKSLGFGQGTKVDGAFGKNTRNALLSLQRKAKIKTDGIVDAATKTTILQWIQEGHTRTTPPTDSVAMVGGERLISPRVPHFSQGDPRWGSRTLGRSSSISKQGCAISSIAMILRFYGRDVDPGNLDAFLDANGGYSGNSVVWSVAGKFMQTASDKLKYHSKSGDQAELRHILAKRVEANRPTMVRVDYGIDTDLTYNHFVVCVGITADGKILMNDPATRHGDGYYHQDDNILEAVTRKGGYRLVKIDYYDPA